MSQTTLARRTLGPTGLLIFSIGASSPLTVLVGGIVSTYALTGVVGVPLSFLLVMLVLAVLAVGYVSVSRHLTHSAPFFAQITRGLGPEPGVVAAAVALLGYNAIQISLYGLIGSTVTSLYGGPWWGWAVGAWLIVAGLGQLRGVSGAKVLGLFMAIELAVILFFDVAAFFHPAQGSISFQPLMPSSLAVTGISGTLAFTMASFIGVESPPAYGEEAHSPTVVTTATFVGIAFLGVFYAVSAWAYATATGPARVVDAARDPAQSPFALLERFLGPGAIQLATVLLVTSALASMVAFHSTVARYVFALAREEVLPGVLARVSTGSAGGAPLGGSILQSAIAFIVLVTFALSGADPMTTMFVWLSTIGAVSVLVLLTASSVSARAFFRAGGGSHDSFLVRRVLPPAGAVLGLLVLGFMLINLSSLLGTPPGSLLPALVVVPVLATAGAGLAWARRLRRIAPDTYAKLGHGTPNPLTVLDQRLSDLAV